LYLAATHPSTPPTTPVAVLGAGSWGTALAILLARNQHVVYLWDHDAAQVQAIERSRTNQHYLPNIILPDNVKLFSDLALAIHDSEDILIAVPSHVFRLVITQLLPFLTKRHRLIWATKGLDPKSGKMLHEVVNELITWPIPQAVLAGPSFALEVAAGLPTAVTVASTVDSFAKEVAIRFHNNVFRVYTSSDMIGVQIASTVKNVMAVATGIADGLGFGANARSALITRGLAEMIRLGIALGGQSETFIGLAGVGDLVLTCTDNQSRNRRFGLAVGGGMHIQQAEREIGQVVEGARNAAELYELSKRLKIDMPITTQVYRILFQNVSPHEAVSALLSREPRSEKDK
jgi:glycerol-3-phosphate dehydrogenase (NAD(P)+)